MALIDDFKTKFPEFDSSEVDSRFPSLESEWPCLYGCEYGQNDCSDQAILYLIAFLFFTGQNGNTGSSRSVASKTVGSVSVSYAQGSTDRLTLFYNTNRYGQMFLQLSAKNAVGGFWV